MKTTAFAISAIIILFNFNSSAQLPADSTKKITLNEVVISVNKVEETKKTIAQQVISFDQKEIAATQSQTTADLVSSTGNVFVQKSQLGGGSAVLRGFEASRTLLMIDGVRMNNLIYRAGHLQNIITLDNNSLERMEILFGPSSTVYGSDALGGVLHFYTKDPRMAEGDDSSALGVNAFSRYGSADNEFTGHADVNFGSRNFASYTSFTYSSFDDLRGGSNQNPYFDGSYGERPYYAERFGNTDSLVKNADRYLQVQSGYSQYDIVQKFALKQNEHVTHGLNIQYSNSSDVPRYDRLTDPAGAGLRYAEWYYGPQSRMLAAYDLERINHNSFFQKLHAGLNYQSIEESRHTRRFGNDNIQHRIENVNVAGASVDLQRIVGKHNLRVGADAHYNTLKSTANEENMVDNSEVPIDTRYPDGENTMSDVAAYYSHTWQAGEQVIITDGLRLGYSSLHSTFVDTTFYKFPFSEVTQNNFVYSGSVGVIHSPSDDTKLSFLVSTGFRTPNVDDMAKVFESAPGVVIVPNEDLKPEMTINYELGITKIFNQRTSWENIFYYTDFKDAIVADKFTYNGQDSIVYDGQMSAVYANQNKKKAYIYGFSSNLRSQWTDNLNFLFAFNYTYGRIKTDSSDHPLDHIPPVLVRLQLSYTLNKFQSSFYVNYNGWKRIKDYNGGGEDNEQYATSEGMPAWYTLNLRASYDIHQLISLEAGVENIFDTQYRTFASGINAPGRNVFFALRFRYDK